MKTNHNINDDLIAKYLCGEATPEEAIDIEQWKGTSSQNQVYFHNMEKTFLMASKLKEVAPNKEKAWKNMEPHLQTKSIRFRWSYAAAAVFVGICAATFLWNSKETQNLEIIAKEAPVHQKLIDNSEISLEKSSQITLADGFGQTNRKLKLNGKANFSVVHNEKLPFIIEAQGVFIEDLGTEFSVESMPESDTLFVIVNEGIVRLYDEAGNEIIIKAGQKAWYIRSQKKIITDIGTQTLKFDFKDTALKDVVAILAETYDLDIKLKPTSIGNCRITTQFFDEEIATIITVITETLGFKYQYQDQHYIIQGKPCQ